jgi:hypothetical protein
VPCPRLCVGMMNLPPSLAATHFGSSC